MGRGLPSLQVASKSIQPFGHSTPVLQTAQRSDSTGLTVLQTVAQKLEGIFSTAAIPTALHYALSVALKELELELIGIDHDRVQRNIPVLNHIPTSLSGQAISSSIVSIPSSHNEAHWPPTRDAPQRLKSKIHLFNLGRVQLASD